LAPGPLIRIEGKERDRLVGINLGFTKINSGHFRLPGIDGTIAGACLTTIGFRRADGEAILDLAPGAWDS
jgi:hypothetical protein